MFHEKEVITKVLSGDRRAFKLLAGQYEHLVFHVINRIVRDTQDREDICQEVFIKVHKNLPKFGFQSKLSTWIAQIAYFTAISYVKKYRKEFVAETPDSIDHLHFTTETPEQLLMEKDVSGYVERLVMQLPEKYRTVITLYHLNEFSYEEIAEITGMPDGTVKNYLFRARKLLKERLEIYLKDELI